jgi:CO/xanthine dehydrogenase FAD-binding subunit
LFSVKGWEAMLSDFQTIHRPESVEEAAELLQRPGVYPLYGSGASLIRAQNPDVAEGVDLRGVVSPQYHIDKGTLWIGTGTTIQDLASLDDYVAEVVTDEAPETLRNVLTLGDVLMERRPDSLVLGLLLGFKAQLYCFGLDPFDIEHWYNLSDDERRQHLVLSAAIPDYRAPGSWRLALEKVSRTPSDAPIVAAIGYARGGFEGTSVVTFYCVVCGLADRPIRFKPRDIPTMQSQIDDHLGSAEYRAEMGKLIANRAVMRAVTPPQAMY